MNRIDKIRQWAVDKGIMDKGTPEGQFSKTMEEVRELEIAIDAHDMDEIKDGIGDVTVTLVLLAEMYGLTWEECVDYAYNEISGRTGKMVNGVFVKDSPK